MLGSTLLFEENHLVGFLPLRSYLDGKKQLGAGKKCPPEEEDLVRNILFRDALERLKCTKHDTPDLSDKVMNPASHEESKDAASESPVTTSLDNQMVMNDLFAQIDLEDQTSEPLMHREKPLIVLDAQNVAMRHGQDKLFSCRGIQIAIQFWVKNGHKVLCFLPEYLFDYQ